MIISISGPTKSGKTTIINLLKNELPADTVYIEDLYRKVWKDLVSLGFSEFREVQKDRDFLLLYIQRVCDYYNDIINNNFNKNNLVVLENCYLDYLIYSQLSTWYHYPAVHFQEGIITKLLRNCLMIDKIYMTTVSLENDSNYKKENFEFKNTVTEFRRNRNLELLFYDLYRDNKKVLSLSTSLFTCDKIIIDDLRKEGII